MKRRNFVGIIVGMIAACFCSRISGNQPKKLVTMRLNVAIEEGIAFFAQEFKTGNLYYIAWDRRLLSDVRIGDIFFKEDGQCYVGTKMEKYSDFRERELPISDGKKKKRILVMDSVLKGERHGETFFYDESMT